MIRKAAITGLIIALAFMAVSCSEDSSGPKNTAPEVSILKPAAGATRAGVVDIIVEATDNKGIDSVELYVAGTLAGTDDSKPYSFEYDMSSAGATVSIYVKAIDTSGNTKSSDPLTITKGGSAPVIGTGSADVTVDVMQGDLVTFTGDATDAEDGTLEDANISWSSSLQGPLKEGTAAEYRGFIIGDHVITMTATDSNGNTSRKSFDLEIVPNDKDYAYIQEGTYTLGPPIFEERTVVFERPFLISKTEYTFGDFVSNLNNDTFTGNMHKDTDTTIKDIDKRLGKMKDANDVPYYPNDLFTDADKYRDYPVCFVGAVNILEYCQALSLFDNLAEAYQFLDKKNEDATEQKPTKYFKAIIKKDSKGWRLPTEAEWEVAANGGNAGKRFPWGDQPAGSRANTLADQGPPNMLNFAIGRGITPIKSYLPNSFGLYDIAGNVGEMCSDIATAKEPPFMGILPSGIDFVGFTEQSEVNNLVKGGTWYLSGAAAQVAVRQLYLPCDPKFGVKDAVNSGIGFRLVRNLDQGEAPW